MSAPAAGARPARGRWLAPIGFCASLCIMWFVPGVAAAAFAALGWLRDGMAPADRAALSMVAVAIGCAAVVAFAALVRTPVPWRPVRLVPTLGVYLPAAVVWLAAVIGYLWAAHAAGHTVPVQPGLQAVVDLGPRDVRVVAYVVAIVFAAPVAEEIVFRGYLLEAAGLLLARGPAQVVTALLFGLAHGVDYALPMMLLGLVFGWLRQRHASLWPSVCAHVLHNGLTLAVALWAPEAIAWMYPA